MTALRIGSLCLSTLLAGALNGLAGAQGEPFRDGEVVCFLGDSITKGGDYHGDIRLFYATRFPDRHIRFHNCGVEKSRILWISFLFCTLGLSAVLSGAIQLC